MKKTTLFEQWYGQPLERGKTKIWFIRINAFRPHTRPARLYQAIATSFNSKTGELYLSHPELAHEGSDPSKVPFKLVDHGLKDGQSDVVVKQRVHKEGRQGETRFVIFRNETSALDFLDTRREMERQSAEHEEDHDVRQKALMRLSKANFRFMRLASNSKISESEINKMVDSIEAMCEILNREQATQE